MVKNLLVYSLVLNPIRPGMEHLPQEVIAKQQQARIAHLEHEIKNYQNQIEAIKLGKGIANASGNK